MVGNVTHIFRALCFMDRASQEFNGLLAASEKSSHKLDYVARCQSFDAGILTAAPQEPRPSFLLFAYYNQVKHEPRRALRKSSEFGKVSCSSMDQSFPSGSNKGSGYPGSVFDSSQEYFQEGANDDSEQVSI